MQEQKIAILNIIYEIRDVDWNVDCKRENFDSHYREIHLKFWFEWKFYIYVEHNGLYMKQFFCWWELKGWDRPPKFQRYFIFWILSFFFLVFFYNRAINSELLFNIKFCFTFYCYEVAFKIIFRYKKNKIYNTCYNSLHIHMHKLSLRVKKKNRSLIFHFKNKKTVKNTTTYQKLRNTIIAILILQHLFKFFNLLLIVH